MIMKKTLSFVFALCFVCQAVWGQDDGTTTNTWNSMPDLAPTEVSWDYALSPSWYYWFGFGFGVLVCMTGVMVKVFQTLTGAGDQGGAD